MKISHVFIEPRALTNRMVVCCRVGDVIKKLDMKQVKKQNPRRQAGFFSHLQPLRLLWSPLALCSMLCTLFVSSLPAQQRLVPPAPEGKPELTDHMRDSWKEDYIPFRREWRREALGKSIFASIVSTRGWVHTMKSDDGKIFKIDDRELFFANRLFSERLVIRGKVEPFEQQNAVNAETTKKAGLRSLIYTRPDMPEKVTGVPPSLRQLRFLLYTPPEAAKRGATLPLIVFLPGIGARGTDNFKNYTDGGAPAQYLLEHDWQKFMPCYVLIPQSDVKNDWWADISADLPSKPTLLTGQVIDVLKATSEPAIDLSRLYVTGFSGGGFGCYEFLRVFPRKFAAAVPLAAYNNVCIFFRKANTAPVWQFINEKDPTLYWRNIRWELDIWKNLKVEHRLTIYEGAGGHRSWETTMRDGEFRKWLQRQKLNKVTYPSDPSEVAKE